MDKIERSLKRLQNYIERQAYKGYDPYDALLSPVFQFPLFKNSKWFKFAFQQFIKRAPLNLRPLFNIPKGHNPVTLGLAIQGYTYLWKAAPDQRSRCKEKIENLTRALENVIPGGYSGASWGYDFPWEARYAQIPAYQPTVVATGIVTNGLFEAYRITGPRKALDLCERAVPFVLEDLERTYDGNAFCFSYSPFDQQTVYNASMKGARLLSQVYSIQKDPLLKETAEAAVRYVADRQNADGSWYYGDRTTARWIDNYHTGYILDCLDAYLKNTGDQRYAGHLRKGYAFYKNRFFEESVLPKFYHDRAYPVDCTAGGQALLTLSRFGDLELAIKVAHYLIDHMQDVDGYFYFRKYRYNTNKTPFMRWSQAWMFAGLAYLLYKLNEAE